MATGARKEMRTLKTNHIALGILVLALLVQPARPSAQQDFAGTWEVNPDESDDPQEKLRAVLANMQKDRGGRGRGGPPPEAEDPNERQAQLKGMHQGLKDLSAAADLLKIELLGNEFQVTSDDGGRVRIFYLDGKKHVRETPDGTKLETLAQWDGKRIVVEQKAKGKSGGEILETYELGSDPSVLVVTFRLKIKQLKEPIVIRSVYDALTDR
jgi:hypothetical protein